MTSEHDPGQIGADRAAARAVEVLIPSNAGFDGDWARAVCNWRRIDEASQVEAELRPTHADATEHQPFDPDPMPTRERGELRSQLCAERVGRRRLLVDQIDQADFE